MATLIRSKSCSFIPQDLPVSELFLDIKANRERICRMESEIIRFSKNLVGEFRTLESSMIKEIRFLKAQISVSEREIKDLNTSLQGLEHLIHQNAREIKKVIRHLQEINSKVDRLAQVVFSDPKRYH